MEHLQKLLFAHIRDDQVLQLLNAHAEKIKINTELHTCIIAINKLFAYNILSGRPNTEKIEFALERAFGHPYVLILKNTSNEVNHDREMAVPRMIHR